MRIARFVGEDGREYVGRLVDDRLALPLVGTLFGEFSFASEPVVVRAYRPPIQPPNIFAVARNYAGHVQETKARLPAQPLIFMKATTSLVGHGEEIVLPAGAADQVDFEAELAIVIGRRARALPEETALDVVLGYTCSNDVSARDCQAGDRQWTRAKSFDTFCPLGPWLVTPDELDPDQCAIRSRLNGRTMQDAHTSAMIHSCRQVISFLSRQFTLLPGTVILTGTPEGVGFTRQPPVYLRPGDRIEVEIEGIGVLGNRVMAAEAEK